MLQFVLKKKKVDFRASGHSFAKIKGPATETHARKKMTLLKCPHTAEGEQSQKYSYVSVLLLKDDFSPQRKLYKLH